MYYPIGWPKTVNLAMPNENTNINHICCDAVKILVAAVGDDFLGIFYANPLIPIAFHRRNAESLTIDGANKFIIWKPDSRQVIILTTTGVLLLYHIDFNDNEDQGIFTQVDPPTVNLKRDSAELFIKENIPRLSIRNLGSIRLPGTRIATTVTCISLTDLLIATDQCELMRIQWLEMEVSRDDSLTFSSNLINLRSIPFHVSHDCPLKSMSPIGSSSYVAGLEYSPFISGCAIVFNDCRAAFLIAMHLRFEVQKMHGIWVPNIEDATVCSVNHKFRLLAYGRRNSDVIVYAIEDATGGLELSHRLSLNSSVLPGMLGATTELKWSPDGCVIAVAWQNGGIALWSTFGTLLMSSLNWDFGVNVDLVHQNPLQILRMEWCTEGYQLFLTTQRKIKSKVDNSLENQNFVESKVMQLSFVKSTLTLNPCMTSYNHLLLQGEDTLYLNQGDNLEKMYFGSKFIFPNNQNDIPKCKVDISADDSMEVKTSVDISSILSESKFWSVIQLPQTYASTNWPIRYSAIDAEGLHLAVAGRTGFAHCSILTRKWKLFGNESQEKDFVVSGGLLWWQGFIIMGCYSLIDRTDELRCYPEECKLDNQFGNKISVNAPVITLNIFLNQLIVLTAYGIVSVFVLHRRSAYELNVKCAYEVDVKSICIHPACIVSLTITNLKNELTTKSVGVGTISSNDISTAENIIVNVCGRILMIQCDARHNNVINSLMATCLASCVECFWLSNSIKKSPMRDCLWLYSGAQGMRVWLPILPPNIGEKVRDASHRLHTFMSKRIMLSFPLKLYPLVILFDNVIVLGVENETILHSSISNLPFVLPFCVLERKSQVYLHKILRQLIKRNLGYSAWGIAKSCRLLPYFPHSLELLLHEVLEEEATSKEPIPDALLPSVLDFIREFPVYLQTIVQCARKTEIALWPYLFSIAGKPKDLFQQCLQTEQLDTASSYLIILQNLEPSLISKQYATLLLDIALEHRKWDLSKDLVRFLKAIDPDEIDSPRSSIVFNVKIAPPSSQASQVNQHPDVFNLVLGPIARERSFSTTVTTSLSKEKKDKSTSINGPSVTGAISLATTNSIENGGLLSTTITTNTNHQLQNIHRRKMERSISTKERRETFSIDIILQRHARQLLKKFKLIDLGYMSAFLDFHLVTWLSQETERTAHIDDFISALTRLHEELQLPPPLDDRQRKESNTYISSDYSQYDTHSLQPLTSSHTSESGYFSLTLMDTPTSINNGKLNNMYISAIKEEKGMHSTSPVITSTDALSQYYFVNSRYRQLLSLTELDSTNLTALGLNMDANTDTTQRILPEKLAIKIRYLLQLFIEANCTDYALLLSILLQDAASIGRIINVIMRSESLIACNRIDNILKSLTQWAFDYDCIYRPFIISLQHHLCLLDKYIKSSSEGNSVTNTRSKIGANEIEGSIECNVESFDNLQNFLQTGHIRENNPSRSLDKFNNDAQNSIDLKSTTTEFVNNTSTQTDNTSPNAFKEQDKNFKTSNCNVM